MSWQATAWVSSIEDAGGPSGKLLLFALANYADEFGRTFPGDERLQRDTQLSVRAIRDWKRKLEEAGLIKLEKARGKGGQFTINAIVLQLGKDRADSAPPANSAGGEDDETDVENDASPAAEFAGGEEATTGKSRHHHRQMTSSPSANDAHPPTPPYIAEPSIEPPKDPIERERASTNAGASDGEHVPGGEPAPSEGTGATPDQREFASGPISAAVPSAETVETSFDEWFPTWPTHETDNRQRAEAAWNGLTKAERRQAAEKSAEWLERCRRDGRRFTVSASTYLRDKRWNSLKDLPKSAVPRGGVMLEPFSKPFQWLYCHHAVGGGNPVLAQAMLHKVKAHEPWAAAADLMPAEEQLAGMVAVPVDSEAFAAWADHFRTKNAVLLRPSKLPVVWLPAEHPPPAPKREPKTAFEKWAAAKNLPW